MTTLLAALIVAVAVYAASVRVAAALKKSGADPVQGRTLDLLAMFAPAVSAAAADPRAILAWQPLVEAARRLFPEEFARLDGAAGGSFPFSRERLQAAHAHWTADWLAWERAHDSEYKLKAAIAQHEIAGGTVSPLLRAKVEAVEQEKLELYQRRYEEYVRVAKALQALI
jgi:hypothetical protein